MTTKLNAGARLQSTATQVQAADRDEAGKALVWLEGILGKGKPNKSEQQFGWERVEWDNKQFTASLERDSKDEKADLSFFITFYNTVSQGAGTIEFEGYGKTFEKLKTNIGRELKRQLKLAKEDLADMQKSAQRTQEIIDLASKLGS